MNPANHLPLLPILIPLTTAVATFLLRSRDGPRTLVSLAGGAGLFGAALLLALRARDTVLVYRLGGDLFSDGVPFGILLEVDQFSAFMILFSAFVLLVALAYSVFTVSQKGQRVSYHSLYHFMAAGVMGAYSTGDLFNLFVWFEVLLMATYVLAVFYSGPESTRSAFYYVAINLLGSALMLVAIGGIYASVGTLNMAHVASRMSENNVNLPALYGISSLLLAAFILKAGAFPLHSWVPEIYPAAPPPVSAVLAGVVKKVGVYGVIRVFGTVLWPLGSFFSRVVLLVAVASALYGGLAAFSQDDLFDVLSYSSIAQIGFVFMGVGVGLEPGLPTPVRVLGLTAALVYSLNHALIKSMLFMIAGQIEELALTTRYGALGGLSRRVPVMSYSFFVGAVALIGVPPLNGFFGKLLVFDSAVRTGSAVLIIGALLGAVLTLLYFSRVWVDVFWGVEGEASSVTENPNPAVAAIVVVLAVTLVLIGVFFDPFYDYAVGAARAALDIEAYTGAVLGGSS